MNNNYPDLIIGIDYGTSTTVVTYRFVGQDKYAVNYLHDSNVKDVTSIPSLLFYPEEAPEKPLIGKEAEQEFLEGRKGRLVQKSKLKLKGNANGYDFEEGKKEIGIFFKCLFDECISEQILYKNDYNNIFVYFSIPAKWDCEAKEAMKQIITDCGFGQLRNNNHSVAIESIDEPTAALHYLLDREGDKLITNGILKVGVPANCLLLDMGAGTSDIVMFQAELYKDGHGNARLKDIDPHKRRNYPQHSDSKLCGGSEIDSALLEHISGILRDKLYSTPPQSVISILKLKTWKETDLSTKLGKNRICKDLPNKYAIESHYMREHRSTALIEQVMSDFSISRYDFENWTKSNWNELNRLVMESMADYEKTFGVSPKDIDLVILTGGHSSWYCVENLFNGNGICNIIGANNGFAKIIQDNNRLIKGDRPSETVAAGMCMQDTGIRIPRVATNDMYISFSIEGEASEVLNIVKAGTILPFETEITQAIPNVTRNIMERMLFNVNLRIFEGKDTSNKANCVEYTQCVDTRSFTRAVFDFLIGCLISSATRSFDFSVKHAIKVSEDQCLSLVSTIYVDGRQICVLDESNYEKVGQR